MIRVLRAALAFAVAILTAAAVAGLLGVRVHRVSETRLPPGVPGYAGTKLAKTSKHYDVSVEDRSKWVYPAATFVGVFGVGLAQIVLTHRRRREHTPGPETDSGAEPPLP